MKKQMRIWSMMMLSVMTLPMMVACGGDDSDDGGGIDTTPISLTAGKDKTIQGADTISSSNEFVAYGKKNVVHGWHVGEATLMVNGKKTISISVLPMYHLYDDPVCNWGCNINYVKSHQTQGTINSKSTNDNLIYENAGAASALVYVFKNGALSSIGAVVSTNHTSQYASYLSERYLMLPYYHGEDTYFIGADAIELEKAKTVAVLQVYSSTQLVTIYMPASDYTRSAYSGAVNYENIAKEIMMQLNLE
jgi:hypothetical protein